MMDGTMTHDFEGHAVNVVDRSGELWFVAREICDVLEIVNSRRAVDGLDGDEKGVHTVNTPGGPQQVTVISESGLYSLVLRSRKPQARAFRRWVTHEVIPSIRRSGRYEASSAGQGVAVAAVQGAAPTPPPAMPLPDTARTVQLIEDAIARALDAGVTDECLARLTVARLEIALGRAPEMPALEFKARSVPALPAPAAPSPLETAGTVGMKLSRSMPEDGFMLLLHPRTLERLDAGEEPVVRYVLHALRDLAKTTGWRDWPSCADCAQLHREAFPEKYAGRR